MTKKEAMQQALEALESCGEDEWYSENDFAMVNIYDEDKVAKAIPALRAALEQPEPKWISLTDDEIKEIVGPWGDMPIKGYTRELFDRIDEALRRKNT